MDKTKIEVSHFVKRPEDSSNNASLKQNVNLQKEILEQIHICYLENKNTTNNYSGSVKIRNPYCVQFNKTIYPDFTEKKFIDYLDKNKIIKIKDIKKDKILENVFWYYIDILEENFINYYAKFLNKLKNPQINIFFNIKSSELRANDLSLKIRKNSYEYDFCKIFFRKKGIELEYGVFLNKISIFNDIENSDKRWRFCYDLISRLNKKIKESLGIDNAIIFDKRFIKLSNELNIE